jgi:hypothetical protein
MNLMIFRKRSAATDTATRAAAQRLAEEERKRLAAATAKERKVRRAAKVRPVIPFLVIVIQSNLLQSEVTEKSFLRGA